MKEARTKPMVSKASSTNVPRVGVGIIVIKDNTQILLHQRKKKFGNGYWGSGGGHLEQSESLLDGAMRELREEMGEEIQITSPRFIGVCNFTDIPPEHYVDVSFVADWISGEAINTVPDKNTAWQWFELDELPDPLFPVVKHYLKAMKTGQLFIDSAPLSS